MFLTFAFAVPFMREEAWLNMTKYCDVADALTREY